MGAGDYIGDTMPSIAEGDKDTNYYVYDSEDDIYKHYQKEYYPSKIDNTSLLKILPLLQSQSIPDYNIETS